MDLKIKIPTIKYPKISKEIVRNKTYENLEGEIWCPIKFNPNYKVSNKGRILTTKDTIAKPFINNAGYYCIGLWSENKKCTKLVHKLVAMHFMDYDSNLDVDHIDGNKLNNNIENLRLVTHQDNCSLRDTPNIFLVDKEGNVIKTFSSYVNAAKATGFGKETLRKNLKDSIGIVKITNYKQYKDYYFIRK